MCIYIFFQTKVLPAIEPGLNFGDAADEIKDDGRSTREVYEDIVDKMHDALEPFKQVADKSNMSNPDPPAEQKQLLECFKKNPGNSLRCSAEIQNFVDYASKLSNDISQQP
jgi:hypothetical protein